MSDKLPSVLDKVSLLSGVGPQQEKKLSSLGIETIKDLLYHFPFRYEDLRTISPISELNPGQTSTIEAKLLSLKVRQIFRRRISIVEAKVSDNSGSLNIVWFNQPYLKEVLKLNRAYFFSGKIVSKNGLQMQNPQWELAKKDPVHTARIVPVYPLVSGIYPKWLRSLIRSVLSSPLSIPDFLPDDLIHNRSLFTLKQALTKIHFPEKPEDIELARKRLSFDEILFHQLKILQHKKSLSLLPAPRIMFNQQATLAFIKQLPFTLTTSQKKAAWQIIQSFDTEHPASRLLSGDVGSGKTVVAALSCLQAVHAGLKTAIMVPTEILASQHFTSFVKFPFPAKTTIGLLTGSSVKISGHDGKVSKKEFLERFNQGNIDIVIGTHALIQKNITPEKLGLVVVDEQHRFGVQQRAELQKKTPSATIPHFLSLTATPIPRTLALTLYGDLAISSIDELPPGRKPVQTEIVEQKDQTKLYEKVKKLIAQGQQVFAVCPLIDPSDKLGVKSTQEVFEHFSKEVFPKVSIGVLHGRIKSAEKETILQDFTDNKIQILISTTVIEVGIDFPNATVMLVLGAERFGLAQLHQLRGRVGRGKLQSYCFLLPENLPQKAEKRLNAMTQTNSGLKLAEFDLKLRGPGDIYGSLQSGFPEFKIADLFDIPTLTSAKEEAENILNSSKLLLTLKNNPISAELLKTGVHME